MALSACSAGQLAETANKEPSVYGVNARSADGSVLVRGLAVVYRSVEGYPAGGSAPLEVALYNETQKPLSVRVTSAEPPAGTDPTVAWARGVGLTGAAPAPSATASGVPAEAEPTGTPEPASPASPGASSAAEPGVGEGEPAPQTSASGAAGTPRPAQPANPPAAAARPAIITIPALSSRIFQPDGEQGLQITGLSAALRSGMSVNLVFQFSNGSEPLVLRAPVGVPLTPAPRGSAQHEGIEGGVEGDTGAHG
jgi:hypothetical protein